MVSNNKILSIQYLRGFAALAVVFCHYGSSMKSYPKLSTLFSFGQSGVYIFFLITGFIIVYSLIKAKYKINNFFEFLLKRSLRIDPSYYVVILLTIVLFKFLAHVPSFRGQQLSFIPGQIIAHILYIVPFTKYPFYNSVFWTLCVEFQFYLLIGILYFIFDSTLYKNCFLILFALTCFFNLPNAYFLMFTYAPLFTVGISLVQFYQTRTWLNAILPTSFLGLIAFKFGLIVFFILLFSILLILFLKKSIRILSFFGDISYSLYLTHVLIHIVLLGSLKKLHIDVDQHQLFWLFMQVVTAVTFAYVFYLFIEKPSLNWSKKVIYKKV